MKTEYLISQLQSLIFADKKDLRTQKMTSSELRSKFDLDDGLRETWSTFTESSDEKCFRKFVRGFVNSWEKSNSWDDLMTSSLNGG